MNVSKIASEIKSAVLFTTGIAASLLAAQPATAQQAAKTAKVGGAGLYELAVSESTGFVYVASAGSRTSPGGKVYKLDPKTLTAVDSIDTSDTPPMGVGINDKTQTLYTSNTRVNSVSAIDLNSGKIVALIKNGKERSHTREIVVDATKNLIYVSDVGEGSSIWVIDGKTNTYLYSIEETGKTTTGLALDEARQLLYTTNMGSNEIGVVDLAARKLVKSYPAHGDKPVNLVFDKATDRLFVADQGSNEVLVLRADNGELIRKIAAGKGALGIRLDPVKKRVYTANRQDGTVTVIDSDSYAVLATLEAGSAPNTVVVNAKTGAAYVTNKTKPMPRPAEGSAPVAPAPDLHGDTVTLILP